MSGTGRECEAPPRAELSGTPGHERSALYAHAQRAVEVPRHATCTGTAAVQVPRYLSAAVQVSRYDANLGLDPLRPSDARGVEAVSVLNSRESPPSSRPTGDLCPSVLVAGDESDNSMESIDIDGAPCTLGGAPCPPGGAPCLPGEAPGPPGGAPCPSGGAPWRREGDTSHGSTSPLGSRLELSGHAGCALEGQPSAPTARSLDCSRSEVPASPSRRPSDLRASLQQSASPPSHSWRGAAPRTQPILSPSSSEEICISASPAAGSQLARCPPPPAPPHNAQQRQRSLEGVRATEDGGLHGGRNGRRHSTTFDELLDEIYERWQGGGAGGPRRGDSVDSDTLTDTLTESELGLQGGDVGGAGGGDQGGGETRVNSALLRTKSLTELRRMRTDLLQRNSQASAILIKQLKRRNRRLATGHNNCDVITAILHASSLKRRVDSQIKFSIEPLGGGDDAFSQWRDAMKAVARLRGGIPPEFRSKVWLALADHYLASLCIDWDKTRRFAFNERSNPDDNKLGLQIVKDLHRTGCSGFSGSDNEEDRAVLKRVLLAYARWNKHVGYCQGFNVLAALILDVMGRREDCALKVMILLVDKVLPEGYFANSLRALSVDMAVFRDLLHSQLPHLSTHLLHLQTAARDLSTGANYEPPLTNVFTMQWFLTLFATCLCKTSALRVWDSVLLEGSEVLLRTAISIWAFLQPYVLSIQTADEFYSSMALLTQHMVDGRSIDPDLLMQLSELREKYTYNITPFSPPAPPHASALYSDRLARRAAFGASANSSAAGAGLSDDEPDENEMIDNINCFAGFFPPPHPTGGASSPYGLAEGRRAPGEGDVDQSWDVSRLSPGAYTAHSDPAPVLPHSTAPPRISLDMDMLRAQYRHLRHRQQQAHIIFAAASARVQRGGSGGGSEGGRGDRGGAVGGSRGGVVGRQGYLSAGAQIEGPTVVNHLFVGRELQQQQQQQQGGGRNRTVLRAPSIALPSHSTPPCMPSPPTPPHASSAALRQAPVTDNECRVVRTNDKLAADVLQMNLGCEGAGVDSDRGRKATLSLDPDEGCEWKEVDSGFSGATTASISSRGQPSPSLQHKSPTLSPSRQHKSCTLNPSPSSLSPAPQQQSPGGDHAEGCPPGSPVEAPPARVFNPFPRQYVNERRARHGLRLGLYAPSPPGGGDGEGGPRGGEVGARGGTERARRDACVHRQYLAQISATKRH